MTDNNKLASYTEQMERQLENQLEQTKGYVNDLMNCLENGKVDSIQGVMQALSWRLLELQQTHTEVKTLKRVSDAYDVTLKDPLA